MTHTSMRCSILGFRCRLVAYVVLTAFMITFLPPVVLAQQPTATLSTLTGTVLVNGQSVAQGAVLQAGDVIETQNGASVVLELSDGSQLELSENTRLDLTQLSQTSDGARVSKIKLAWGWVRAKLSPGHQDEGSTFDVETPNALVGVKFSQPWFDVGYMRPTGDAQAGETRAIARTVPLTAINLLTNETILVPVGSTVIISALGIQIIAGIVEAGAVAEKMGTGTKIALGAGAALATGGIVALATSGGGGSGDNGGTSDNVDEKNFTGRFEGSDSWDGGGWQKSIELMQEGTGLTGSVWITETDCDCTCEGTSELFGEIVDGIGKAYATPDYIPCSCTGGGYNMDLPHPFEFTLTNNGDTLVIGGSWGGLELQRTR